MSTTLDDKSVRPWTRWDERLIRANWREVPQRSTQSAEGDDRSALEETIPLERMNLAKAGIRHLSAIVRSLNELRKGPESDDFGILRPTRHAYDTAISFLVDAAIAAARESRAIPLGQVSTDSEGGVRVEWIRPECSVHFVVPRADDQTPYIYHEIGNEYATQDATFGVLAFWLRKIN